MRAGPDDRASPGLDGHDHDRAAETDLAALGARLRQGEGESRGRCLALGPLRPRADRSPPLDRGGGGVVDELDEARGAYPAFVALGTERVDKRLEAREPRLALAGPLLDRFLDRFLGADPARD